MNYEEISRRTLPQINAILSRLPENIQIKQTGMPNIFAGSSEPTTATKETSYQSSQEEIDSFFA